MRTAIAKLLIAFQSWMSAITHYSGSLSLAAAPLEFPSSDCQSDRRADGARYAGHETSWELQAYAFGFRVPGCGWFPVSAEGTAAEEVRWPWRRVDFNEPFLITEQIDGSRVGVHITRVASEPPAAEHGVRVEVDGQQWLLRPMSPIRWLGSERDNFGFAAWVHDSAAQLIRLGQGWHYGVWYGRGIIQGYGLDHRRLALYDAERWSQIPERLPDQVEFVPIVGRARGSELSTAVDRALRRLERSGSLAVPGQNAEGIEITPTHLPIVRFKMALKSS